MVQALEEACGLRVEGAERAVVLKGGYRGLEDEGEGTELRSGLGFRVRARGALALNG